MKLTFDLPQGKVTVDDSGIVEIKYNIPADYAGMAITLAGELGEYLLKANQRTADEFSVGLREIQDKFVTECDYEKAAICRDARILVESLTARNEALREELRKLQTPLSARVKRKPPVEPED